ncbi:MAG: hypothetical protein JSU68_00205 [Phycisphaerales bacterium]|nr:MAG: hypothetical protein JSU68_00205 [Phycisphaerales bacterium]
MGAGAENMGRILTAIVVAVAVGGCESGTREPARERVERSAERLPAGRLGYPLGTYLRIEGVRAERGKVGVKTLAVERIDGREVSPRIRIWIENVERLPEGTRCVLNGYESGKMIGLPFEVAEKENMPLTQAVYQFYRYFVVTSVVEPEALKKEWRADHHR